MNLARTIHSANKTDAPQEIPNNTAEKEAGRTDCNRNPVTGENIIMPHPPAAKNKPIVFPLNRNDVCARVMAVGVRFDVAKPVRMMPMARKIGLSCTVANMKPEAATRMTWLTRVSFAGEMHLAIKTTAT